MSQNKTLFKNTIVYAIGSFGSKALSFLLLPLYSFYLSKSEFGTYDLFISALSFLVPLLTLQTSDSVYRWLIKNDIEDYNVNKIITNGLLLIIFSISIGLIPIVIYGQIKKFEYSNYFYFLLITSGMLPFFQCLLRGMRKTKLFSITGVINTLIVLILNITFLIGLKFKIEGLFVATILANLSTILIISFKLKIFNSIKFEHFDYQLIKAFLSYSLPLVPNMICWWLINIADKFIILYILSVESNGIYAIATRFPGIIILVNSIFLLAWQDHSIQATNSDESIKFRSILFKRFVHLEFSLIFILISVTPFLFNFFIAKTYFEAWELTPFLYLGAIYSSFSAFVGVGYQLTKRTVGVFSTTLIGGVINVVISFTLMRYIGLFAPALGSFVSFLIIYIIRKYQTRLFYKIDIGSRAFILYNLISLGLYFIVLQSHPIIQVCCIIISFFYFLYINRDFIKFLNIKKIKLN